jgi:hypothetical protein
LTKECILSNGVQLVAKSDAVAGIHPEKLRYPKKNISRKAESLRFVANCQCVAIFLNLQKKDYLLHVAKYIRSAHIARIVKVFRASSLVWISPNK